MKHLRNSWNKKFQKTTSINLIQGGAIDREIDLFAKRSQDFKILLNITLIFFKYKEISNKSRKFLKKLKNFP